MAEPSGRNYPSLAEAEAAVLEYEAANGASVNRARSKKDKKGAVRKVWLSCAHGGEYKNRRKYLTDETQKRKTSSRCTNCPWSATLQRVTQEQNAHNSNTMPNSIFEWKVVVEEDKHNHDVVPDLSMYPEARTLSHEDQKTIERMSNAGAAPKVILATLRQEHPATLLIAKDIYNAKAQLRNKALNGRTPLEMLLDDLKKEDVIHAHEHDDHGRITRFFFAPTKAVQLLRDFPHVVLMDSTYKTNRYGQ
jgi:hypothetical protein